MPNPMKEVGNRRNLMQPSYHAGNSLWWISFHRMPNNHFIYITVLLSKQNASGSIDVNDVFFADVSQYTDAFHAVEDRSVGPSLSPAVWRYNVMFDAGLL